MRTGGALAVLHNGPLFRITVPVQELAAWQQPEVHAHLRDTLRHLTGDNWHFTFIRAQGSAMNGIRQRTLHLATISNSPLLT